MVERALKASVRDVWDALTNVNEMRKWYFNVNDFRANVGFEFEFTAGADGDEYLHKCEVTEVEPFKKLAYSWRYDGFEGNSLVVFELYEEGDHTRVRIKHTGLASFPDDEAFSVANFNFGWAHILNHQLKDFVENK